VILTGGSRQWPAPPDAVEVAVVERDLPAELFVGLSGRGAVVAQPHARGIGRVTRRGRRGAREVARPELLTVAPTDELGMLREVLAQHARFLDGALDGVLPL
jgi:hypothetical protein